MRTIVLVSLVRPSLVNPEDTASTIFLTGFSPWINNLCSAIFYISALEFSLFQTQHKPFFSLVLIPTQAIFPTCFNFSIDNHTSAAFHLSVFIPVKITSSYLTTNFCFFLCKKDTASGDRQQFYPYSLSIRYYFSSVLLLL